MPLTSHRDGSLLLEGEGIVGETVISDRLRVEPGRVVETWRERCLARLGSAATSLDALVSELRAIVAELGFEHCSYVYRRPLPVAQPIMLWSSTYPQGWLDRYFERDYLHVDPLVRRAFDGYAPVVWGDQGIDEQPEFWEEARAFGIRHGWAIASRGHAGTVGLLSVARSHDPLTASELDRQELQLLWLAHSVQALVSTLPGVAGAPLEPLSAREREVLRWSAGGKTADEIGVILSITPRTVTFHVNRCIAKLEAANKTEAVAKALVLGLL